MEKAEKIQMGGNKKAQERPMSPPFQKDVNGKLQKVLGPRGYEDWECSCCAWGQVFWDEKRKMRFLFTVGG